MRFYLNPCFSRYSFDKSDKEKPPRMTKKDHNFNQSCSTSNGSTATADDVPLDKHTKKLNHEAAFDLVDNYQEPNDRLTMEYRNSHQMKNKKHHGKCSLRICFVIGAIVLVALAVVVTYICVRSVDKNAEKNTDTACKNNSQQNGDKTGDNGNKTPTETSKNISDVCESEKCKFIAENLKKSINFSADPCQNFHEFACGMWPVTHTLPASLPKLDTMGTLNLQKNEYLKDVIEKELKMKNTIKQNGFKDKLLRFYKSCKNLDEINSLGSEPLLKFIASFGHWSPLKQWRQAGVEEPDVTELLVRSHQYFPPSVYDDRVKSPLFKTIVKVNDANSKQHLLEMNIPDLPVSNPENYLEANPRAKLVMKQYFLLQSNYVALLGPSRNAEELLKELLAFEKELANIAINSSFLRMAQQTYNYTSIKDFMKDVGTEINWLRLIQGYFKPHNIKITEDSFIGIRSIKYFRDLDAFLKRTKTQTVKDYIVWVCVWRFGSYASAPYQEAEYTYQQALMGIQELPKRWKRCVVDLEETMEFGLASLFVKKALTDEGKRMATEMVRNITQAFKRNLVSVEWMDVGTKARAFEKVDSIRYNIGYPDYVKDDAYLDILYERVQVDEKKYFQNSLNVYREKRAMNLLLLHKPVDKSAYDLPPTLVEAYFDPNKNKMVFLAGIMSVPFYDMDGPMALNYGALGLVVGHEVTHAFDDLGRMFDGNGEKKNWWTKSSTEAFNKRSKCMVQQYSNYTLYGENVNGGLTLGENIADNGGIKVAYLAYKDWERTHGKEKKLPGIPLTMDQLLFVSHGQVWCGAYREEYVKRALKTDYHSPAKYRTIGPLSNLKAFSDAFKCPLGTPMNPVKKCRVW